MLSLIVGIVLGLLSGAAYIAMRRYGTTRRDLLVVAILALIVSLAFFINALR